MSAPTRPGLGSSASPTVDPAETVDARMIVLTRCMLAFSALAIIWIDPSEPARLVELTYGSLAIYCIYSAALALISSRADWPAPKRALHWVDILFYAYLVGLTEGTSSIFFYFFFFAILVASFAWGFRESLAVTLASFALFTTVGLTFAPTGDEFELNRTLIRAVYLFVFGYMIAYWGGYEALLKRRLKLLREINNLWNPRFGVAHAVGTNLDRLLAFFGGTSCVLVLRRSTVPPSCLMYTASLQKPEQSPLPSLITEGAAEALLHLPDTVAAYYHDPAVSWLQRFRGHAAYDVRTLKRTADFPAECEALANLLDAQALITVPYAESDGTTGRIFVVAGDMGFTRADIEFLTQAMSAFSTVVDNMRLTEELISQASKQERLAISRDLHDSTIQALHRAQAGARRAAARRRGGRAGRAAHSRAGRDGRRDDTRSAHVRSLAQGAGADARRVPGCRRAKAERAAGALLRHRCRGEKRHLRAPRRPHLGGGVPDHLGRAEQHPAAHLGESRVRLDTLRKFASPAENRQRGARRPVRRLHAALHPRAGAGPRWGGFR